MMKRLSKKILIQSIVWSFVYVFWALLRQFGQDLVDQPPLSLIQGALIYFPLGFATAIVFVLTDRILNRKLSSFSFGAAILIRSVLYLLMFFFLLMIGTFLYLITTDEAYQWGIAFNYFFSKEGALLLVYFFLNLSLIQFIQQVDKKFGPGNLLRMLKGEFYQPREVERIVMFLDLKSSTAIAEKIGNVKFSEMLQDCFHELNIIQAYQAEIYQYVGDEAVLVWEKGKGVENFNCIQFYFAFSERLINRADYFQHKYGIIPEFKCGCHIGKVIMTEIGQIKREIAYHGDVMNTAARIQGQCNQEGKRFLLSEDLYQLFPNSSSYKFTLLDTAPLKGKTKTVKIYSAETM